MAPTALITGASRGIGRGIALVLAEHGFDIAGTATQSDPANTESGLYEVKARVEALGRRFEPLVLDVAHLDSHGAALDGALAAFGRVDVLVNNAGVAPLQRLDLLDATAESYDRVLGINLRGPFFFTQRVARQMIRQVEQDGDGRKPMIIFITSISARAATTNRVEYCVSKAGLSMTAQAFAYRLAEHGINVYELQPGITATDMTAGVKARYDEAIAGGLLLQRRWGTPEDVGKACAALALGFFDYATGAVIEIGGGFGVDRL